MSIRRAFALYCVVVAILYALGALVGVDFSLLVSGLALALSIFSIAS